MPYKKNPVRCGEYNLPLSFKTETLIRALGEKETVRIWQAYKVARNRAGTENYADFLAEKYFEDVIALSDGKTTVYDLAVKWQCHPDTVLKRVGLIQTSKKLGQTVLNRVLPVDAGNATLEV